MLASEARALSEEAACLHSVHEASLAQHALLYSELASEVSSAHRSLTQTSPRHAISSAASTVAAAHGKQQGALSSVATVPAHAHASMAALQQQDGVHSSAVPSGR